ncbi:hypothetical protein NZK35_20235 [Stieleria sp. ICT_E10.1]|nr:hypothetical protein [Stieleria sedimenti]
MNRWRGWRVIMGLIRDLLFDCGVAFGAIGEVTRVSDYRFTELAPLWRAT